MRVDDPSQLKAFVGLMKSLDPKRPFLVQEYVGDRPGEDLRVLVIGGRAIGAMKRHATDGDFRANISRKGKGASHELCPEVTRMSETAARMLGLEIAGVDLLFSGNRFVLCEVNSSPGFKGFEEFCGKDVAHEIATYVAEVLDSKTIEKAN